MPRLSTLGSAIYGIADTPNLDGSPVAAMAGFPTSGPWGWISPTVAFGPLAPAFASTDFSLYTYDPGGPTLTLIDHYGANGTYVQAGGGNWACWVSDGRGVKTNLPTLGPFPAGYVLAVSAQGEYALEAAFIADSGINVYAASGVQIDQISGTLTYNDRLRAVDGVLAYALTGQGWRLRDYRVSTNLSILVRSDAVDQCVPIVDGTDIWVLERNNVESLTLRKKDDTTAWLVRPPAVNEYLYPDAIRLSAGVVRIAWVNTIGEAADSLFVMDVTLATGANDLATVVAGALVFVPQAALGTTTVTGTISPGGGGGWSPGGPSSPGRAVLNQRAAPPPPVRDPRRYPHVDQIQEFPTKQSLRLAWDQLGTQRETLTALQATIDAQAQELTDLRAQVAALARAGTVSFKGVTE